MNRRQLLTAGTCAPLAVLAPLLARSDTPTWEQLSERERQALVDLQRAAWNNGFKYPPRSAAA